jgi:hypothetical protein
VLQRTTLTPPLSPPETTLAPAQVARWLPYFLILVVLTSAVACAIVWQANTIKQIQRDTYQLRLDAERLERANARLMMELAVSDTPATVEREAARLGLAPQNTTVVHVAPSYWAAPAETAGMLHLPGPLAGWINKMAQRAGLGGMLPPSP